VLGECGAVAVVVLVWVLTLMSAINDPSKGFSCSTILMHTENAFMNPHSEAVVHQSLTYLKQIGGGCKILPILKTLKVFSNGMEEASTTKVD